MQQLSRHFHLQLVKLGAFGRIQTDLLFFILQIAGAENTGTPDQPVIRLFLIAVSAVAAHDQRIGIDLDMRIPFAQLPEALQPCGNRLHAVGMNARRNQTAVQQGVQRKKDGR